MALQISGHVGEFRVGHQLAAKLRSISGGSAESVLTEVNLGIKARVEWVDAFWSTQRPLTFRLSLGDGIWWEWRVISIGKVQTGVMAFGVQGIPEVVEEKRTWAASS